MQLDLNKNFVQLNGDTVSEQTMGQVLANMLASIHVSFISTIKSKSWALKLFAKEILTIDEGDLKMLKDFLDRDKNPKIKEVYPPFTLGQLEEELSNINKSE